MALTLRHQTKLQFCKRLRDKYRAAEKLDACRIAYRMLKYLDGGDVTQANMLNAWNMTQAEWDLKRANKLQPRADKWVAYKTTLDATANEGAEV
jgi:hypothetical protein